MRSPLHRTLGRGIESLFPGYFALVMATGIVSIAAQLLQMPRVAVALLAVNAVAYVVLLTAFVIRLIVYFPSVLADLNSHARGPGFFTIVAGTCVLGTEILVVTGRADLARPLWTVGVGLWFLVMYAFFTAVIVRGAKPTLEQGINGAWLIATVATQSVAVLALALGEPFGWPAEAVAFGALVFFLIGCMLYLAIITLIFYRFTFLPLEVATLTPPYWISMGAVAITTLAGSTLVLAHSRSPLLVELAPFLKGFTLFFWAAGTWWIPLLVLLGVWRHLVRRHPIVYDPQYWAMVFPLGMYTAATFRLSEALPFEPLEWIAGLFLPIACAAWAATALGLVRHLARVPRT